MEQKKTMPATKILTQQAAAIEATKKRVSELTEKALAVHYAKLEQRNLRLKQVNASTQITLRVVQGRHQQVSEAIRGDAIAKDVHLRVSRSLESLEEFVKVMRRSNVSEEKLLEAIRDPVVSGTYFDRERRASVSGFVQDVQRQLMQQYEFLNIAAHELRTPIMPILANAEILQARLGSGADTKELDTIRRNALRLQRLSENILSAAKIDSNSLQYSMEEFDLNEVIRQAVQDMDNTIKGDRLRIVFIASTEELRLDGDKDKIAQVVVNLLDNALKFTKEGRILVTSAVTGDFAEVSVSDEGPGIDSQVYPLLFTKFATKSLKGTGLGLFICKKLIEAHGGMIWARNSPVEGQGGAIFTFTLPMQKLRP